MRSFKVKCVNPDCKNSFVFTVPPSGKRKTVDLLESKAPKLKTYHPICPKCSTQSSITVPEE
jgi:hypothetical protein